MSELHWLHWSPKCMQIQEIRGLQCTYAEHSLVPRLLDNFQSQHKGGKRAWEQGYADFATLVHVTSNSETVGIDYGNICTCIMLVTTVEKLM